MYAVIINFTVRNILVDLCTHFVTYPDSFIKSHSKQAQTQTSSPAFCQWAIIKLKLDADVSPNFSSPPPIKNEAFLYFS